MKGRRALRSFSTSLFLTACLVFVCHSLLSAALSYDLYAPLSEEEMARQKQAVKAAERGHYLGDIGILPLDFVLDKLESALKWIETYHIPDKVEWAFDWIEERGFTVHQQSNKAGRSLGTKSVVEFEKVLNLEQRYPALDWEGWASVTLSPFYQDYGTRLVVETPWDFPARAATEFRYESRPEEDFWGLGPTSSLGDGVSYKEETTSARLSLEADLTKTVVAESAFGFRNVNITEGEDDQKGRIDAYFGNGVIAGTTGAVLLSGELALKHDNRNDKAFPTAGGQEELSVAFYGDVSGADVSFFRYHAEAVRFWKLFKPDRALALRVVAEHNDEVGDNRVPFYLMSRLGGIGTAGRSEIHRGFYYNRFFDESMLLLNVEYRYNVWEYRNFDLDVAPFVDVGQVFREISKFRMDRFRASYGAALRMRRDDRVVVSLDIGHSDEGTHFFIKTRAPF